MVKRKNFCRTQEKRGTSSKKKIKTKLPTSSYVSRLIKDEITFDEEGDSFPGFSTDERTSSKVNANIIQRLVCGERREAISTEECIKDGNKNVICAEKLPLSCVNHKIKDEITFDIEGDCFAGFSVDERKSSKEKADVIRRFVL